MNNINFVDNINNDKFECGNLNFENDLIISLTNSSFINNYSDGNGGAMYEKIILDIYNYYKYIYILFQILIILIIF